MSIEIREIDRLYDIDHWKRAYLRTLVRPLDGYWETAVIGLAAHYKLLLDGEMVGYFAANQTQDLLQFCVDDPHWAHAPRLFDCVLNSGLAARAAVCTAEPAYLSLCLDRHTAVTINSYLFDDFFPVQPAMPAFPQAYFRPAVPADVEALVEFYAANDDYEDSAAIEIGFGSRRNYAQSLVDNDQVFLLLAGATILGIGECRLSASQLPYADVGMITARPYRRRGVGAYILARLKEECYQQQARPICSCAFENMASRQTIEKAGFITQHRILNVAF